MKAPFISILAAIGGSLALALAATPALAGGGGGGNCGCGGHPKPPPPPQQKIKIDINLKNSIKTIVNANANANANASAMANAFVTGGGSGNGSSIGPAPVGLIQNLEVGGGVRKTAYEAERTKIKKVVIEAICIDDKVVPHPASQVTPDRDIDDAYEGELYRCIAGTRMHVTFADYNGEIAFDHGWTLDCDKGQA
ncbi:MAG TPA: hypothetical protein VKT30_07335, partial [Caulobacteraceae bacterium]|nr:hypothetical protein [Caulobacteraceae bacterium]